MLRSAFAAVLLAQGFAFPPVPTHFLTDNTGVLDLSTRAYVESDLHAYERATGHHSSSGSVRRPATFRWKRLPARRPITGRSGGVATTTARCFFFSCATQGAHRGRLRAGERADRRGRASHHRRHDSAADAGG